MFSQVNVNNPDDYNNSQELISSQQSSSSSLIFYLEEYEAKRSKVIIKNDKQLVSDVTLNKCNNLYDVDNGKENSVQKINYPCKVTNLSNTKIEEVIFKSNTQLSIPVVSKIQNSRNTRSLRSTDDFVNGSLSKSSFQKLPNFRSQTKKSTYDIQKWLDDDSQFVKPNKPLQTNLKVQGVDVSLSNSQKSLHSPCASTSSLIFFLEEFEEKHNSVKNTNYSCSVSSFDNFKTDKEILSQKRKINNSCNDLPASLINLCSQTSSSQGISCKSNRGSTTPIILKNRNSIKIKNKKITDYILEKQTQNDAKKRKLPKLTSYNSFEDENILDISLPENTFEEFSNFGSQTTTNDTQEIQNWSDDLEFVKLNKSTQANKKEQGNSQSLLLSSNISTSTPVTFFGEFEAKRNTVKTKYDSGLISNFDNFKTAKEDLLQKRKVNNSCDDLPASLINLCSQSSQEIRFKSNRRLTTPIILRNRNSTATKDKNITDHFFEKKTQYDAKNRKLLELTSCNSFEDENIVELSLPENSFEEFSNFGSQRINGTPEIQNWPDDLKFVKLNKSKQANKNGQDLITSNSQNLLHSPSGSISSLISFLEESEAKCNKLKTKNDSSSVSNFDNVKNVKKDLSQKQKINNSYDDLPASLINLCSQTSSSQETSFKSNRGLTTPIILKNRNSEATENKNITDHFLGKKTQNNAKKRKLFKLTSYNSFEDENILDISLPENSFEEFSNFDSQTANDAPKIQNWSDDLQLIEQDSELQPKRKVLKSKIPDENLTEKVNEILIINDIDNNSTCDENKSVVEDNINSLTSKEQILSKMEIIFTEMTYFKEQKRTTVIEVRKVCWENCVFENERVCLKPLGEADTSFINPAHKRSKSKYQLIIKLLEKIQNMLKNNLTCTKRETFYEFLGTVDKQIITNKAIDTISILLEAGPWQFGIIPTSKGLIFGNITIYFEDNTKLECNNKGGTLIPQHIQKIKTFKTDAKFILIIEKDSIFQQILNEKILKEVKEEPSILITAKGYPDTNTRLLLNKLSKELSVPIYILTDADPHGMDIMFTYRFGSLSYAHLSSELAVPKIRWLGVYPSDITLYGIPHIKLTSNESKKVNQLLTRPYIKENENIRLELNILKENKRKAEIEGLIKTDFYLSSTYLKMKLDLKKFI